MGDQTLVELSIDDVNLEDPGFVHESPKMTQRKNTR